MTDKTEIIKALDVRAIIQELIPSCRLAGGELSGLCPFHDDHNPSLSINPDSGVFKCHACGAAGSLFDLYSKVNGCDFKESITALAKRAGMDTTSVKQRVTGRYDYHDQYGNLLYWKERIEPGQGGRSKDFRFYHGNRKPGRGGEPVIYAMDKVATAKAIIINEGEKQADIVNGWNIANLAGTTLDSGSQSKPTPPMIEVLSGKRIIILRDNDPPGLTYALTLARALYGKCESLKVVLLPGLPPKGDLCDWIEQPGNDKERLFAIIKETPDAVRADIESAAMPAPCQETEPLSNGGNALPALKSGRELAAMNIVVEWLVENLIPRLAVILLYGRGGIGKTTLAMMIADAIERGKRFFGLQTVRVPVIVVDYENSLAVLSERAKRTGVDGVLFLDSSSNPPALDKPEWTIYMDLLKKYPGALFIFDTLRSSHSGDENDSRTMQLIMSRMRQLRDAGATVILLHHTPKGNDRQFKGSGAIFDLCDQTLALYQTAKPGSEQEAQDDDDDPDKVYRFGTGKKTRYKPHRIFLTFDPENEIFTTAKDPTDEALEHLFAIVCQVDERTSAKQNEIIKAATEDQGYDFGGDKKIRALLKRGDGKYWNTDKGLHNSKIYRPIQFGSLATPYRAEKLPNWNQCGSGQEKQTIITTPQASANTGFGSLAEGVCQTEKLNANEHIASLATEEPELNEADLIAGGWL